MNTDDYLAPLQVGDWHDLDILDQPRLFDIEYVWM